MRKNIIAPSLCPQSRSFVTCQKNKRMKIALFSEYYHAKTIECMAEVMAYCQNHQHEFTLVENMASHFESHQGALAYFDPQQTLSPDFDYLFSFGGDGTLLRSVTVVQDSEIPILGINTGHLGFLTSLQKEELHYGLDLFFAQKFSLVKRSLLSLETEKKIESLAKLPFALNEITLSRKNTTAMLNIQTAVNEVPLTTYWSDGLIIATPTGSTGYSLSSGGPILTPETQSWVLNPIAPHNINMRPLIISDKARLKINVTSREEAFLVSLDSRLYSVSNDNTLYIKKAPFKVFTVELEGHFFFKTLREKLFWGQDTRNTQ